ncbi:cellulose synthase [Nostoc sp. 'Peltigera membranacea cyanobiont' 210A]|uniref:glycosyltransferase n=1 Tax=Nostoc sp. 'Peltigera membranacea cyanobiont' 210A TaxID=2014529 RepID=UPI000B95A5D2|nr:glycosyltransferase [Nostoc sp. 'Peltigera membranacea cyanobiont' 210A]OYD92590.1 cellulose synthase [Nostoc sp. 'Peltigera membranacea cyanobiont' 210A]
MTSVSLTNFSGNSRSLLKKRTLLFRYLAEINLIFGIWYLQWRITHSINFDALWISIPLLIAEIYSYFGSVMFVIGLWRPLVRQIKSLDQMTPPIPRADWPTVDVFVTCYNEPPEIVEETAKAALAMDYPPIKLRVYVLDDGNSADMRAMTERLCIEDLQSAQLQVEAERIDAEHSGLLERLKQLENLTPNTQAAEQWLQTSESVVNQPAAGFVQSLRSLILWLPPTHQSIRDSPAKTLRERLITERKTLEEAIYKKELELVELTRFRYIARPKTPGVAHHAKAGNINYAIFSGETSGNFIVTLDADHIPKRNFLKRVLPYFYAYNLSTGKYDQNQIAFVQTRQDFYNIPPGDPFGHRANLFYGPLQQGKDGMNAAFYTGTNAILRREALVSVGLQNFADEFAKDEKRLDEFDLVGGVSSNSITEDMNTAMRLHSAGWKSIYHNELLAEGLAPDDLSSTLKQRLRWAQGTIQVLVRENPLTKSGLTFWQRLQYFKTMYSYFSGFATLVFISCPIIYFFTDIVPVKTYGPDFAIHFFPAFIINRLTFLTATWGIPAREVWRSEQYAIALFPLLIQAVWSVLTGQKLNFQVTPKQRQSGIYLRLVWPQLVVFILTILGILWSLYKFAIGHLNNPDVHLLNGAWAIYNLLLLWAIIRASVWQPPKKVEKVSNGHES